MSIYETIKDMPIFRHFSDNEKKTFAQIDHSLLGFNKDDIIIKQGEECSSLYLLVKGTVLITKTGFLSLSFLALLSLTFWVDWD